MSRAMMESDAPHLARRPTGAMWTHGELLARAQPATVDAVFDEVDALLHEWTARYTRFDPSSVLERLNDAGGGDVSDELADILQLAEQAWYETGGRFDVGLGAELIAEGYDRDADDLPEPTARDLDPSERLALARAAAGAAPAAEALAEPPLRFTGPRTVRIRAGSRLDLGGFVKGWAADRACQMIAATGCSCLVNLGGDIAVHVAPGDAPWPVALHLPGGVANLDVSTGGVATSGQEVRLWHIETADGAGRLGHHIIDPRTAHSAASDISRITVVSSSCARAEIWAKALLIAGSGSALDEAQTLGVQAVGVGLDGSLLLTEDLR